MGSRGLILVLVLWASTVSGQTLSRDLDSVTIARPGVLDRTIRGAFDRTRSRIDSVVVTIATAQATADTARTQIDTVRTTVWSKVGDTLIVSGVVTLPDNQHTATVIIKDNAGVVYHFTHVDSAQVTISPVIWGGGTFLAESITDTLGLAINSLSALITDSSFVVAKQWTKAVTILYRVSGR